MNEPTTADERAEVAQTCKADLGLRLPMLLDDMENSTDAAYSAGVNPNARRHSA